MWNDLKRNITITCCIKFCPLFVHIRRMSFYNSSYLKRNIIAICYVRSVIYYYFI